MWIARRIANWWHFRQAIKKCVRCCGPILYPVDWVMISRNFVICDSCVSVLSFGPRYSLRNLSRALPIPPPELFEWHKYKRGDN